MPIKLDIQIKGFREVQRALKGNDLYAKPFSDLMHAIGARGENIAASAAPKGATGLLETKITFGVQKRPLPLWVAVRSRARRRSKKYPRGYPYGRLLNYSPKHGHMGWFTDPLKRLGSQVQPLMARAASAIEANWRRIT